MTIDLTCQKCEGSFELDVTALIEGAEKLACPNCNAKTPTDLSDDFTSALSELITQVGNLSKRFLVSIAVESDELPGSEEEDEDEDDDDDDDSDDDDADPEEDDEADGDDEDDDDFGSGPDEEP